MAARYQSGAEGFSFKKLKYQGARQLEQSLTSRWSFAIGSVES